MPLPEADKKSPRVYTLAQNTDLENIAFATLQSIGQPINIEEMNEDELRRLVLVNLARLAVKGEWSGLLSAGGGDFNVALTPAGTYYSAYGVNIASTAPYGCSNDVSVRLPTDRNIRFWPFIATNAGDVASATIECNVAAADGTTTVAFYTDDGGKPDDQICTATFATTSTGAITQSSLSATFTTVVGTQYWYAVTHSTTNTPYVSCRTADYCAGLINETTLVDEKIGLRAYTVTSLPDPVDLTDIIPDVSDRLGLLLLW